MREPCAVAVVVASAASALAQETAPAEQSELAQEILIVASRRPAPAGSATSSVASFGPKDFERRHPLAVTDVLREASGVSVSPDGPAGQFTRVFLRGAASNQTLVLVDGIPQNDATAGGLFDFGDLTMTGVERIEVLRGSYSVLYGSEAIGGVVDVRTRRGRGDAAGYARARVGSFGERREEAGVSYGDDRFDLAFAAGDSASRGRSGRDDTRSHDAVGRVGFEFAESLRVDGSLRASQSYAETPFDFASSGVLPEDDNLGRRRRTIAGGATLTWDAHRHVTVRATVSALDVASEFDNGPDGLELVDPDFTPGSGDEFRAFRDELVTRNAATDWRGRLEATATLLQRDRDRVGLVVTGGGEHLDQRTVSTTTTPNFGAAGSSTSRLAHTTRTDSLFVQAELRAPQGRGPGASKWDAIRDAAVTVGFRTDDHSVFGREGSPYVGARAEVLGTTARASYGEGFRAPKPSELFDPFVGNESLGPEDSESFDVGLERAFLGDAVTLGATWFRLDVDGLIAYDATAITPARPFGQLTNFARTRTTGFEYEAAADLGCGFRARAAYTTQNPRDRDTGAPLPNRARRFGSVGVSWEGGDVLVSVDGFFSGENGDGASAITGPDEGARRQPGERRIVDLTVSYRASESLTVFGGVRNLLDDDWVATPASPVGTGRGFFAGVALEF